jgi:bacillithiol system protein YtxJ
MGLFRRFRSAAGEDQVPGETTPDTRLRKKGEWESLLEESRTQPVLVFKHSTTCDISSHVLEDFRRFTTRLQATPVAVVHVIEDRSLSDTIAKQTGIHHETPQVIVIENERPIWHASHWSIDLEDLDRCLTKQA